jgi:hypothetical protein
MDELDHRRLEELLAALAERLEGDWLLVGGALVALWLEPRRVTEDVDLVGLAGTPEERLQLMQCAADLGLPVEAVNSAADFYVRRIPSWRTEIELFRTGSRARIFRPTPTLFLLLKIGRLSEEDLGDCLALLGGAARERLPVEVARVLAALEVPAPGSGLEDLRRRQMLREALLAAVRPPSKSP